MTKPNSTDFDRVYVRDQMELNLGEEDVRNLCFELEVDFEALSGQGKGGKIRELIVQCQRVGLTSNLLGRLGKMRPQVNWTKHENLAAQVDINSLIEVLVNGISIRERNEIKISGEWRRSVEYLRSDSGGDIEVEQITGVEPIHFVIAIHNISKSLIQESLLRLALHVDYPLVPAHADCQSIVVRDVGYICNVGSFGMLYPDEWRSQDVRLLLPETVARESKVISSSIRLVAYTVTNPFEMPMTLLIELPPV